ncbi:hypothetical protein GCM10008955_28740 [Deinococcus malanensis]|uniref:Uncharacterized protein n=1 Tax=Deinococcus malanensis TaxID=1706855 RepID=A0ABQ2F1Q9_9DEIO|nr:hypothetical protein [Deinococcus malanensis]GGK32974.1 hypothetical protein GCM10008955_28740 [Deinococcus malanensis]
MRALLWVLTALLFVTGLVLAVLTMGTFASLVPNGGTSLWLRSLGGIESLLSARLHLDSLPGFTRATLMTILTGLVFALSAFVKPRS